MTFVGTLPVVARLFRGGEGDRRLLGTLGETNEMFFFLGSNYRNYKYKGISSFMLNCCSVE